MTTTMPGAVDTFPTHEAGQPALAAYVNNIQDGLATTQGIVVGPVWVNPRAPEYGAVGDGDVDDYAAIQAAIDDAEAAGGAVVILPAGTYRIDAGTLRIDTAGVTLLGGQKDAVKIISTGVNATALEAAADDVLISDISFDYFGEAPAESGAAIVLESGAYTRIRNCQIEGGWYLNVDVVDAYGWVISESELVDAEFAELRHQSLDEPDRGDSSIHDCLIGTSGSTPYGILWQSGGGLRIHNNKFLEHDVAIMALVSAGISTQNLLVADNSIENCATHAIHLKRDSGTPTLNMPIITGNQIDVAAGGTAHGVKIEVGINHGVIQGNYIRTGSSGHGIDIGDGCDTYAIAGNVLSGCAAGVKLGNATNVTVGQNAYANCTADIVDGTSRDATYGAVEVHRVAHLAATTEESPSGAYTDLFEIGCGDYRGFELAVVFEGVLNNVGVVGRSIHKLITKGDPNTSPTVTAIADTAGGAGTIDLVVTAGTNKVTIQARKDGSSGTSLLGQCSARVIAGHVDYIKEL